MKFKIYSDLHWGQTSEIMKNVNPENGDIFLGDIFDIKNTAKKDIKEQLQKQEIFLTKCNIVGAKYIIGNHDLINTSSSRAQLYCIINNVLFTHGHYLLWTKEKIREWEAKQAKGVGFFRRMQLEVQALISRGVWKPSKTDLEVITKMANDYNCHTIVFGHTHTEKLVDMKVERIRIVNVPRGLTEIEL